MEDSKILEVARDYCLWERNEANIAEIQQYVSTNNILELRKVLSTRMAFGTAGLRGPMGAGYSKMNDLVILQTTQGLAKYLENQLGNSAKERGVVIGYDHRSLNALSSLGFARISAAVLLSQGYKVYCLEDLVPTPFVAFAVSYLNCSAGLMVTASHNPKQDNGFKVYWGNGSQIIPPHDAGIAEAIEQNLEPWHKYDTENVLSNPLAENATVRVADAYYNAIASLCDNKDKNASNTTKIVYTAMHGVGCQWVRRSFETFNHCPLVPVPCQAEPDPSFRTVVFPNPEEKGALDEAMKFADEQGATVIIANDPDADRLAVAEKLKDSNKWYVFSGNEIGVLLGHSRIKRHQQLLLSNSNLNQPAVLASVVSSRMLKVIAESESVKYYDTLTGFKWLGNKALELRSQGTPVLFSYEEALGYCVGEVVCDKDGVSAAAVFTELISTLSEKGNGSVYEHLQSLYKYYGEFVSYNSYLLCYEPVKTDAIFARLRKGGPTGGYWNECVGIKIKCIKDITLGYDSSNTSNGNAADLPATPEAHMIMYEFDNGCTVTLRTSGTEPKIKFYTEMRGQPGENREEVALKLNSFVEALIEEMIQPSVHGLSRP